MAINPERMLDITNASKVQVCLDGRRLEEKGGIGRVTQEILRAIAYQDRVGLSLLCHSASSDLAPNIRQVQYNGSLLSLAEYQQLSDVVATTGCQVFISPQFYAPPNITVPVVSWVHDTWPLLHPEWLPPLASVLNKYGADSRSAGTLIVGEYEQRRRDGDLFRDNSFLAYADTAIVDPLHRFVIAMFALNLARSVRLVTCSYSSRDEIVSLFPEVQSKIRVIYNPVPAFVRTHQKNNSRSRRPTLLHVSKWETRKNVPGLIRAFRTLLNTYPDVQLILVGSPIAEPSQIAVHEMIRACRVEKSVKIFANIPDDQLAELYAAASGFVLPSLHEGFAIPLVEAFAFGLPVAAARRGAIPEIAGDAALYFEPEEEALIADTLETLLFDENSRQHLMERVAHRLAYLTAQPFSELVLSIVMESLEERG